MEHLRIDEFRAGDTGSVRIMDPESGRFVYGETSAQEDIWQLRRRLLGEIRGTLKAAGKLET